MQTIDPIDAREAEIGKIAESRKETAALQKHLTEIIEGTAFKGSHRSGQFLKYIVERAIAGHFDSLKERVIGVELFGRSTSYDTSDDAIVRVTASDVRKRLLQHYGKYGATAEYRINLPSGSYIPEITRNAPSEAAPLEGTPAHHDAAAPQDSSAPDQESSPAPSSADAASLPGTARAASLGRRRWLLFCGFIVTVNLALWGVFWIVSSRTAPARPSNLLWLALFNPSRSAHLITSDPNIVVVQEITGGELTVSDYANHKYISDSSKLTPEQIRISHMILWGDNSSAALDPPITARIAALAQMSASKMDVRAARSIQLTDLKSDDNFIFLGSPRSNPWSALFGDELDFRFAFDKATAQEIVVNAHPHLHEQPAYVPTALGWATGESYAIIAFVQNLDQNGQVLLLAGASGEGTEAAGKLVTDLPRLSATLQKCGIDPSGPLRHFELLMRVNTMAGSPNSSDVVACHILPGGSAQKR
ncbi:MAG: hypothetical protein WBE72_07085 [Terracidiphilus sp.]